MLVTRKNLRGVIEALETGTYAVDCETTGLRAYHGDRLFSLIICNGATSWYFNFQQYKDLAPEWTLDREETCIKLRPFFQNPANIYYMQNAKFDMSMLYKEGVEFAGRIYDTEVMGRLLYNRNMTYSLGAMVKQIGLEKSSEVDDYIAKHKLFSWVEAPGKAKRAKWPHFDKVPFSIMSRYGETDGRITWELGEHQRRELGVLSLALTSSGETRPLGGLVATETGVTKTCFVMERQGIKVDRDYCQRAYEHGTRCAQEAQGEFSRLSGFHFQDSRLLLAKAFTAAGEKFPLTEKGNPSFTDEVLERFTTPLAKCLRDYRTASKRANTYFANFLYFADANDRIHPNMRQAGTDTGRFSYSDPNLQNVPTEDKSEFPVRRAFIPSGSDWTLVSIDFEQMEYRLLLDYAGEMGVIRKILDDGLDVHQATANKMGVGRQAAKTLNFLLLYGGGAQKLADGVGVTLEQAKKLKDLYFESLPEVSRKTRELTSKANTRGHIVNWAGRVCYFPWIPDARTGGQDRFAYRAANHFIQGGCADVVKIAMNRCRAYLSTRKSRLLLQVHDELVFEIHDSEMGIIPDLKVRMETAYPHRHLPLTCSVEASKLSWADQEPLVLKG